MAKKKTNSAERDRAVVYAEVDPAIKADMESLAEQHDRSLAGEVTVALKRYIAECKGKKD